MREIREWLESNGQDYAQGVALYATHGRSNVVLKALQFGASDFTRLKLRRALEQLAIAGDVTENVTAAVTVKPVRAVDISAKRVHVAPAGQLGGQEVAKSADVPDQVRAQRRAWFAERNHLHPQLEACPTDAERLAMSLRILELGQLIDQSYAAVPDPDTAQTPSSHLSDLSDAGEMRRLLANLRPQRTKLKKRPDRASDLLQVEADIKILETKLKASHE